MVLYSGMTDTTRRRFRRAGSSTALDRKVYLDLSFFRSSTTGSKPRDFMQAYVIAHEPGNVRPHGRRRVRTCATASSTQANELVRLELQADCLAGVWGPTERKGPLEPGDAEEGLRPRPRSATTVCSGCRPAAHGILHARLVDPACRMAAPGLASGDPGVCNTFQGVF